ILLVLSGLDVRTVEPLDVALIEDCGPRPDLLELRPNFVEEGRIDHAGRPRGGVTIVLEDVPPAEHEIVERRERNDVADFRRAALGPFSEAHRAHLRERSNRLREPVPNREHAGDRRRAHSAEADEQDAELAVCRSNIYWSWHETPNYTKSFVASGSPDRPP